MKKRNLIYTGLLMLSLVTTPVYAQDKRVEVTNGICMLEEGSASIVIQAHDKQPMNGKTFRMYSCLMQKIQVIMPLLVIH